MRLTDYVAEQVIISESINDKAKLKAVFFVGYPGSGKTTIAKNITDGSLPITTISSDIWTEYLGDYKGETDWSPYVEKTVKNLTIKNIVNNTDGLLPIFVDTTGANLQNFKHRVNILKDLGYDVSLVIIDVKPETSIQRVQKRNQEMSRQVGDDFLRQSFDKISKAIPKFKSVIPDNITIKNDNITDADILKAYRVMVKYFNSPIKNDKGKKLVDYMKENGYKYYREVPDDWKAKNGFPELSTNSMKWFRK